MTRQQTWNAKTPNTPKQSGFSPAEAVVNLIQDALKAKRRKATASVLTDEYLAASDQAFPALEKFAGVTDEQWDRFWLALGG